MAGLERQRSAFEGFAEMAESMGARVHVVAVRAVREPDAHVVVFFGHEDFQEVLFAYQCMPPDADRHERVWLAEEIATGGLHRLAGEERRLEDRDGVVWIRLRGSELVAERMR